MYDNNVIVDGVMIFNVGFLYVKDKWMMIIWGGFGFWCVSVECNLFYG